MKDKLREFLKTGTRKTVMRGESGRYPNGEGWGRSWNEEVVEFNVKKLDAAILDAEGDGGAVAFIVTDAKGKKFTIYNQLLAEAIRHIAKEKGSTLRVDAVCTIPDYGWFCTRGEGHDGPCAAWPNSPTDKCPTCGGPATRHEVSGAFEMRDEYRHAKQSTHPARSGVVSDEDVNNACAIYFGSDEWYEHTDDAEMGLISMRAAREVQS